MASVSGDEYYQWYNRSMAHSPSPQRIRWVTEPGEIEPRPAEFSVTPHYERNVIVGFRIDDPSGSVIRKRQKIFEAIHLEFSGVSRDEFDNASIAYFDYYAEVRLPR